VGEVAMAEESRTGTEAPEPKSGQEAEAPAWAGAQQTSSLIDLRPLYTPADLAGWEAERDLGYPGEYPYTRGVQPTMYRGRLWTMRQYAGMGDAEESNKRYKYLLAQGTTGLSVAFDLPTQIG
jgi:methylmalonyl-CoA mutase, N-terminal domain